MDQGLLGAFSPSVTTVKGFYSPKEHKVSSYIPLDFEIVKRKFLRRQARMFTPFGLLPPIALSEEYMASSIFLPAGSRNFLQDSNFERKLDVAAP